MTRRLRAIVVAGLASLALVLSACAGLPVSGPVNAGQPVTDDGGQGDVSFVPAGPAPDATPAQIVEGFIAAGSGPRGNWSTAQDFLTDQAREVWKPRAGVTIYESGSRRLTEASEGQITVTIELEATVDATGAYSVAGEGETPFLFQLEQVDGQWRISQAPDGIILDENRFQSVFHNYELMYFDASWSRLVPDTRWFPPSTAVTDIAVALVDGSPTPWLLDAVVTAFSPSVGLAQRSVPERSGVAEVSLGASARGLDQQMLDRMQTQLEESLATAGIVSVDMLVDDQILVAEAVPVARMGIDSRPLVLTEDDFGYLSGTQIESIVGLSDAVLGVDAEFGATAIELNAGRETAAVRNGAGGVVRVRADGTVSEVNSRSGLIAPTIDPFDHIWTVPADAPAAVVAGASDGSFVELAGAWPGATSISAMHVSRDGTRVAALVLDGTQPSVWVAGIVRDERGVPLELGEVKLLAQLPGTGVDVAWLDGKTLAAAGVVGEQGFVVQIPVGGPATQLRAPVDVTTVSGGNQPGAVRLRSEAGNLYVQRGVSWQHQASEIRVLASQQGALN
ncbi:LpqB family beta-propeller domain-containing protein [Microbacterium invictum]|uniref:GerMN domain-containing protein n=1 Tax=Microbacterium invictum TaxID=515415 RepID=A0AA40SNX7_9MICO|nr:MULTISPECIES: LpqB family beta-propeller domain-containing protein [Microbacterium]MBB4139723.1 hypothetical protein [Microbacterium invictum]